MQTAFERFLVAKRAEKRLSKRAFAIQIGMDPAYYARIERGDIDPPRDGVLTKIAQGLGIHPGISSDWDELVRTAEIARGQIPNEVLSNATMAAALPAFFAACAKDADKTPEELYEVFGAIITKQLTAKES
jgi:transcriptional regulator with XRE-family HTH domain